MDSAKKARLTRTAAGTMAATRVAIGLTAVARPGQLAGNWLGKENGSARLPSVQILGRASGGRDLTLGLGALSALTGPGTKAVPWLAAGGVVDAVDGMATVLMWRRLPPVGRWVFAAAAGGTAVISAMICAGLSSTGGERTRHGPG